MEDVQENPAESGSSVLWSEEPAGSAKVPEVSLSEESEGCTRPLEATPQKLCGYLSKFGGKGPIRGWKSRWFFFDERKCHLYYSRTAQDANPLDSIDLSSAVFDCKADAEEGTFEIKTPNRIITLKAATKQVMLYWLQQLQMKRWEFHNSLPAPPAAPDAALAGNGPTLRLELGQEEEEEEAFLCPVKTPTDLVGVAAAWQPVHAKPSALQNISLKHLGTEIQNTMCNIRGNKQTQGANHRPPGEDSPLSEETQREEQPSPTGPGAPGKDPANSLKSSLTTSLIRKAKSQSNTFPLFSEGLMRNRTAQEKVLALEQQVLMLTKELKAQKDDMEAYRTQNRFLNSEIHQVTKIWRKVAEKEKALLMKCAYLQAQNCRVESKYLAGLRRLQEALGVEAGECSELLRQLIQEALQWEAREASADSVVLSPSTISEYDEYGFLTVPNYEVEDLRLLAKIQALEVHSHHLLAHEAVERPLRERWATLGELAPSAELKQLLRAGVPHEHRPRVWRWLIRLRVQHLQAPGCYQALLSRGQACKHSAARQIELDLNRTFPNNKHFTCPTSSFPDKLRRVLLAFSWQNPTIGYCQGLNRLAAIALLVLDEEESAFWCLVAIVETIMPADYYSKTLLASQVDQRVLQDLLLEKLPRLMAHLGQRHVDLSFITFNWFLVVFADSLISNILLQVWDAFLYEGIKVVFRYALAIFKYNEEALLRLQDSLEIYQYLHFFTKTICDSRKLMHIAFNDMNPFPMKQLRQLRAAHRERLEAELNELEQLKAEYLETRAAQGPAVPEGSPSEDEGEAEP
ncbi:TBC1 domain family member 2A isoform X2 [Bubalus kerabau]|uniref:TBC1 domain family member 2A isoform X2 n=1 Tax=Bubalus carabanensis TaxID=3119969 RepID=UPI00244EF1F6|nr:TBC1 domain family member 2A isoform X2 [Bubalus carabanensis]